MFVEPPQDLDDSAMGKPVNPVIEKIKRESSPEKSNACSPMDGGRPYLDSPLAWKQRPVINMTPRNPSSSDLSDLGERPPPCIRPGDSVVLTANGRAVIRSTTCLISRNVIIKYLVYFAMVVVYVPMAMQVAYMPSRLDQQVGINDAGVVKTSKNGPDDNQMTFYTGYAVTALLFLPCCCCLCCHTYLQVDGEALPEADSGQAFTLERAVRGESDDPAAKLLSRFPQRHVLLSCICPAYYIP